MHSFTADVKKQFAGGGGGTKQISQLYTQKKKENPPSFYPHWSFLLQCCTCRKIKVCRQVTYWDISSLLKWSNTSVDVAPIIRPWISTIQGSGAKMSFAYCFRRTNGGTGYTGWWWASRHEGIITICVFSLKKKKHTNSQYGTCTLQQKTLYIMLTQVMWRKPEYIERILHITE